MPSGLELFNACHCLLEIPVLHQSVLDEALQLLILKSSHQGRLAMDCPSISAMRNRAAGSIEGRE